MTVFLQIEGTAIVDIPSFHAEINRVFMAGEDWQLGPSLDALDDLLYGGYGALAGHETATLVWRDIDRSREALGVDATRAWLEDKLRQPGTFNAGTIGRQLDALQRGEGQTYFDIVMEIFASHPTITLVQA
ncbi:barstar family protein [Stenotrophomonas sp. SI-NJAU-1]|uniref:barstar family protein n=1 Tax=Stenotrophomonas sp. SI-NJAU-1 TaxID=2886359 RepID=UPI001E56FC42|nr:barstar family protein [Stenotrophomonas sp. SI-NJAU-1]UEX19384.1 barstar family protein [Stenotrophomonas sp. SI-NJAU-1]